MNMKPMKSGEEAGATALDLSTTDISAAEPVKIGEMAKHFGVTLRTLRFYEDKGLINPARDGNTRLYSNRDKARLKLIMLGRKVGFSLRDVKQIMDLYDPTGSNAKQLRLTIDKSEKQLGRLQKQQLAIAEAIDELSQLMASVRRMLAERSVAASNGAAK